MGDVKLSDWLNMADDIAEKVRSLQNENAALRGANEALKQANCKPDVTEYMKISEHNDIVTDFLKQQMATALEIMNLKQQVEDLKDEVASARNDLLDSQKREISTANEKVGLEDELNTLMLFFESIEIMTKADTDDSNS